MTAAETARVALAGLGRAGLVLLGKNRHFSDSREFTKRRANGSRPQAKNGTIPVAEFLVLLLWAAAHAFWTDPQ